MERNRTKAQLRAGQTAYGCFVRYADAGLVELMGLLGWDFLVFDAEHGTIEPRDCEQMVRAAELRGLTPIVRVPGNLAPTILRYMDTGAQGAQIPWIEGAADAAAAVRAVKYAPAGGRGLGGVRAAGYGQLRPLGAYAEEANRETLVVVQVETAAAVAHIDEIVAVDGVDVVFIGPTDLSQSLGVAGMPQHPDVQAAMAHIAAATQRSSVALGIFVGSAADARTWRERGARYIVTGLEGLLRTASNLYREALDGGV